MGRPWCLGFVCEEVLEGPTSIARTHSHQTATRRTRLPK